MLLPHNEAVRIARHLPQRPEVAAVLRTVDRRGQLLVGRQLVRLVGEAVGVVEAHEFLPQLAQLALLLGSQLAARGQRLGRLLIFLLTARFGK